MTDKPPPFTNYLPVASEDVWKKILSGEITAHVYSSEANGKFNPVPILPAEFCIAVQNAEMEDAYSPARDQREAAAARAAGEPPVAGTTDPNNPPAANAEKFKIGKYEVSEQELASMMDRQAQDDLRKATVPPTPNDYKLELSPGAKLPGEVEYKFDASNPGLTALRNFAHAKGFDQSTVSEILTIYATHEAQENAMLAERSRAEIAKAGVNAPQRVDAIGKWIRGEVGDADAKPILATIVTDAHLRFYEKMMINKISQGTAPFSQQHRSQPDGDGIPGFDKMSFAQQRQAQDQLAARRR